MARCTVAEEIAEKPLPEQRSHVLKPVRRARLWLCGQHLAFTTATAAGADRSLSIATLQSRFTSSCLSPSGDNCSTVMIEYPRVLNHISC
jgi:hypothetical protein